MKRIITAIALAIATAAPARAAEVAGVAFEPAAQVAGETLQLNGAGLRKRFFVEVYAAGLYVPQRTSSASALLAQDGPRRVVIAMLRDVGADQFLVAISDGLAANHTRAQLASLSRKIEAFKANLAAIGEARSGDRIHFDYTPAAGTRILVNGAQKGAAIPGPELYRAVLRVWLGDSPVDAGLKQALLGL